MDTLILIGTWFVYLIFGMITGLMLVILFVFLFKKTPKEFKRYNPKTRHFEED